VHAIRQELKTVAENGISADELQRAQRYLIGTHAIGLQRKSAIAAALAFYEAYGQGAILSSLRDNIMKVTVADVVRVARKYLDPRAKWRLWSSRPHRRPRARAAARSAKARLIPRPLGPVYSNLQMWHDREARSVPR